MCKEAVTLQLIPVRFGTSEVKLVGRAFVKKGRHEMAHEERVWQRCVFMKNYKRQSKSLHKLDKQQQQPSI